MQDIFIGTICTFGFQFNPRGCLPCAGTMLQISGNETLFSLISTIYGGDGRSTFQLPDLRGRVGINQGSGPLGTYRLGQLAGWPTHALSIDELPAHNHSATFTPGGAPFTVDVQLSNDDATSPSPISDGYLATTVATGGVQDKPERIYRPDAGSKGTVALGGVTVSGGSGSVDIGYTGSGHAFPLMQPSLTMNYAIVSEGTYPSRN